MSRENASRHAEGSILASARAEYEESMARICEMLRTSQHYEKDERVRAQAEFYLEQIRAVAFNLLISPQQQYPKFLVDTLFGPNLYPIWAPNPDFKYAWTWLDGKKNYRIWGNRHDTDWGSFQVTSEFWGAPDQRNLGDFSFDGMAVAADGSYEITASATRFAGNWIPLNPESENNYIFLRRAIIDWERENVATAHIELRDDATVPFSMDEGKLAARIARAGKALIDATAKYTLEQADRALKHVGPNEFFRVDGQKRQNDGYNPGASYFYCVYDLAPGEALVVETNVTDARYWGIHTTDIWLQSIDYVHHQASLNGAQARADQDGKLRFVLSVEDPGVPNWLDPVGGRYGMLQFRSYYGTTAPVPTARILPLRQVRDLLPADTPVITPAQRKEAMRRRARAILRHYAT